MSLVLWVQTNLLPGSTNFGTPVSVSTGRRRGRFRSWKSNLYAWDEEAAPPAPLAPPQPAEIPSIEDGSEVPEDIAGPLLARLAAIETEFLERRRLAERAKARAKRDRRIQELAEHARAAAARAVEEARQRLVAWELEEAAWVREQALAKEQRRLAARVRARLMTEQLLMLAAIHDDEEDEEGEIPAIDDDAEDQLLLDLLLGRRR